MSDDTRRPRVCIGLPVYNGQAYLRSEVESLLAQSFGDFELRISDNASTDGTEDLCRELAALDRRIRYDRQRRNIGAAANFNLLARECRSPYFMWAAHDDVHGPEFIERCVGLLDRDPSLVAAHTGSRVIDASGKLVPERAREFDHRLAASRPSERLRLVVDAEYFPEIYALFRTDVLQRTRLMEPHIGADRILMAHVLLRGDIGYAPEPLFLRRAHPGAFVASCKNDTERLQWWAPDSLLPVALASAPAKLWGYLRSTAVACPGVAERLRCVGVIASWAGRKGFRRLRGSGPPVGVPPPGARPAS